MASTGAVDCHFHLIGPFARFPMHPQRSYTPAEANLHQWRAALAPLGITHGVVVQPSFYGTDNRALLAALAEGEGRLVGVAAVAADVTDAELSALAAAGVRGVRMTHFEAGDPRAMGGFVPFAAFDALEDRLHEHSLHLQLFTDSRLLPGIAARLRRAKVPVVIDHMGRTPASLGVRHPGLAALCALLTEGSVWVKLSGVANISVVAPTYDDAQLVHQTLLDANARRLVWGSDWPHTRPSGVAPTTREMFGLFLDWTPSGDDRDRILRSNPRALYAL
jgi:predicted TIM-barrel fold metal-dependent hydrolase